MCKQYSTSMLKKDIQCCSFLYNWLRCKGKDAPYFTLIVLKFSLGGRLLSMVASMGILECLYTCMPQTTIDPEQFWNFLSKLLRSMDCPLVYDVTKVGRILM